MGNNCATHIDWDKIETEAKDVEVLGSDIIELIKEIKTGNFGEAIGRCEKLLEDLKTIKDDAL